MDIGSTNYSAKQEIRIFESFSNQIFIISSHCLFNSFTMISLIILSSILRFLRESMFECFLKFCLCLVDRFRSLNMSISDYSCHPIARQLWVFLDNAEILPLVHLCICRHKWFVFSNWLFNNTSLQWDFRSRKSTTTNGWEYNDFGERAMNSMLCFS